MSFDFGGLSVLTEITALLLHPKLLEELFLPQPVAAHSTIKRLLQDIASTSIMKLDDYSTNKLWDLMTMIFKWQITIATNQNIFDITKRHLENVAMLMPQNFPKSVIEVTKNKIDLLTLKLSNECNDALKNAILVWFHDYHTKISILIRLGLQKRDGTFVASESVHSNILANLGDNIYNYDRKRQNKAGSNEKQSGTNEIDYLIGDIKLHARTQVEITLPTVKNSNYEGVIATRQELENKFQQIDINLKGRSTSLSFAPSTSKSTQDYLLEMICNDPS